ncbi:MAG TPA: beta-N-acetylglucosaminidase domain-containing protein [Acidimicrobiales bacterium]|nr:beta-N-acetylglucosaminidase domain-containing protein [Acidimicrobiales bacterium]
MTQATPAGPLVGVIEGFYGRPWSWPERSVVATWCAERGMTHYVYAPKDDPLHRERWREPYPGAELAAFGRFADGSPLALSFAISPGLSIDVSSASDRDALWAKVASVLERGASSVVLALDDIPDREGLGEEHAALTAWLHGRLDGDAALALVPTQYIGSRPTAYLQALTSLPDDVAIGWTGESVVNDTITVAHAERRTEALSGRPPLLWDNVPVNDAVMADRLFLGPVRGREPGLAGACSGWLANAMVQPTASLLPLASIAAHLRGDDPYEAWATTADELGWRRLAEACDGTEPNRLVDELLGAVDEAATSLAGDALATWLREAEDCQGPGLEDEAGTWIDQTQAEATVGRRALRLLRTAREATTGDDADAVLGRAFRLLAEWPAVRRSPHTVFGPRCSARPALSQRADGGWRLRSDALQEDANALDRLARAALAAASTVTVGAPAGASVMISPMRAFRIALPASDLDRSRAFYERVLGIDADDTVPSRLYFHCEGFIVALIDRAVEAHDERLPLHPLPDNLYFATDDLDATFDRATHVGAEITSPIEMRPWGERSFYCTDPDGHLLCFVDDSTLFLGHGADWD